MSPGRKSIVLALFLSPLGTLAGQETAISRAAWLSGCWESRSGNRVVHEMWMPPGGGMMLGGSRTVNSGVVREFEHLRIHAAGDTLIYTALPSGQKQAEFRAMSPAEGTLVFENPAHDFPTRITYRRISADSAVARVEGPGQGGAMKGFDIPMRRVGCGG